MFSNICKFVVGVCCIIKCINKLPKNVVLFLSKIFHYWKFRGIRGMKLKSVVIKGSHVHLFKYLRYLLAILPFKTYNFLKVLEGFLVCYQYTCPCVSAKMIYCWNNDKRILQPFYWEGIYLLRSYVLIFLRIFRSVNYSFARNYSNQLTDLFIHVALWTHLKFEWIGRNAFATS